MLGLGSDTDFKDVWLRLVPFPGESIYELFQIVWIIGHRFRLRPSLLGRGDFADLIRCRLSDASGVQSLLHKVTDNRVTALTKPLGLEVDPGQGDRSGAKCDGWVFRGHEW